jgi:hypothetical protein
MSIHLLGGGWADDYDGEVYREFLLEATARGLASGRTVPRIAVLLVREDAATAATRTHQFREQLERIASCEPVITAIVEGELFVSGALTGIDGLLVGEGHTPSYLDAVTPIIDEIRLLVADDLPYLGLSAGAMIAADAATSGGGESATSQSARRMPAKTSTRSPSSKDSASSTSRSTFTPRSGARSRVSSRQPRRVSSRAESRSTSSPPSSSTMTTFAWWAAEVSGKSPRTTTACS